MNVVVTVEPTVEPITLAEAKNHLRVDITDDDALISTLIVAARRALELHLSRAFTTQTIRQSYDVFPRKFLIERPSLISISSIVYTDTNGDSQTLAASAYQVDTDAMPDRIWPAYNTVWPNTRLVLNAIQVTYTAGFGAVASDVPADLKAALYLVIGQLYETRSGAHADYIVRSNSAVYNLILPYLIFEGLLV